MLERHKRDICQGPENRSTYFSPQPQATSEHAMYRSVGVEGFNLNYLLWVEGQHDESKDYMLCELTFHIHCHPHASPARPHYEPGHVTPRSPMLCIWNQKHWASLWKYVTEMRDSSDNVSVLFPLYPPGRLIFSLHPFNWSPLERLKKHHLLFYKRCGVFLQTRTWLARQNTTPLLIGWACPVDRRWTPRESGTLEAKKKKNSSYKLHHAPPLSGFGLITGKSFVLKLY